MTADIMTTFPLAPNGLACHGCCKHFRGVKISVHGQIEPGGFTLATGNGKAPINDWRSKEPLRHADPPQSHDTISEEAVKTSGGERKRHRRPVEGMRKEEEEVTECDPCPASFYEEDIENIVLFGKVGGRCALRV